MNERTIKLGYEAPSAVTLEEGGSSLALALSARADAARFEGRVTQPELVRDALLTTAALLRSDLRYRGRDRAAYLAYLMKQGKRASKAIWDAQKQFLESAHQGGEPRPRGLDPVVSIADDGVSIEVFSKDESTYARLALTRASFEAPRIVAGTGSIDLSSELIAQLERLRAYQPLTLSARTAERVAIERELALPDAWLRGLLEVQAAQTLPSTVVELSPIDLYNVLLALRLRRAKQAPRALRFELVPGTAPRIVLEPWETVLEGHAAPYSGSEARVVRIYGRMRLLALTRALPHVRRVRVHLSGPGQPSFWVLDLGAAQMTVALTSWSESGWSSAARFDALAATSHTDAEVDAAVRALGERGPVAASELALTIGRDPTTTKALLQRACLRGQALYELDHGVYRARLLLPEPLDPESIRFASAREATAQRLLGDVGKPGTADVRITKLHELSGEGLEVEGELHDRERRRTLTPRFTLDLDGQVRSASCNCAAYQRAGLREGPCEHMLALYLLHAREREAAERERALPEGRARVRAETRTLLRRDTSGKKVRCRISLDGRLVRVEQQETVPGRPPLASRLARTWFDTEDDARAAYHARLDTLAQHGFLDVGASAL